MREEDGLWVVAGLLEGLKGDRLGGGGLLVLVIAEYQGLYRQDGGGIGPGLADGQGGVGGLHCAGASAARSGRWPCT